MNTTQTRHQLEQASAALARVIADLEDVDRQLTEWSGAGAQGAQPRNGPSGKGGHSDPTGNAATQSDEYGKLRVRFHALALRASTLIADVDAIRSTTLAPPAPADPQDRGHAACANAHGCPDDSVAVKAGRCQPCYDYRRYHDRDRTG